MSAKEIVLGIDFGTSFSTAAAWFDGKMYLVPDHRGEPCIPSVVSFPTRGAPLIGAHAERARGQDPTSTIFGVKRLLGRHYDSNEVRIFDAHSAVRTLAGPGGMITLQTQAGEHTPEEIASYVFRHLRELAERRFRTTIKKTVITVPASATRQVQDATTRAATSAGLDVVRVLSEPSAGAIANQLDKFEGTRRILVYDFGGGTFDVTVLEQRNSSFITRALSGDSCLGGDDLDHELASLVSGYIFRVGRVDITKDIVRWDRIVRESEKMKRALSALDRVPFRLDDAYTLRGRSQRLEFELERPDVEARWEKLVTRANKIAVQTMVAAKLRPEDIDVVLLVGGTTYVPLVRRTVAGVLKKPGLHEGDPQTAVARGAALVAARVLELAA